MAKKTAKPVKEKRPEDMTLAELEAKIKEQAEARAKAKAEEEKNPGKKKGIAGYHSLQSNEPMTAWHLIQILQKLSNAEMRKPVQMFSDSEGNDCTGLHGVNINKHGVITLIPHDIRMEAVEE